MIAHGKLKGDSHFSELCVRFEEIHVDSTSKINQSKRWYMRIRIWSESETIVSCEKKDGAWFVSHLHFHEEEIVWFDVTVNDFTGM